MTNRPPFLAVVVFVSTWAAGCAFDTEGTGSSGTLGDSGIHSEAATGATGGAGGFAGTSSTGGTAGTGGPSGTGGLSGASGAAGHGETGGTAGAGGTAETGGSAGTAGSAGTSGAAGTDPGPACPVGLPGPPMVLIQATSGKASYCIDATEVTTTQYHAWLDTIQDQVPTHDPECAWNATYRPEQKGACDLAIHGNATAHPHWPMVCIDWCDARDYCTWAGKRLCGDMKGKPVAFAQAIDPSVSEWAHACTGNGQRAYPYGDALEEGRCVDDAYDGVPSNGGVDAHPEAVGSAANCRCPEYPQLADMSGNVWEWTNSCEATSPANQSRCRDLGGSFWDYEPHILRCRSEWSPGHVRDLINKNIGIRCCADTK